MSTPPRLPPPAEQILDVVDLIPPGRLASYGDVAELAHCGPRQVGAVLRRHGAAVPWWRVVRADGRLVPALLARAAPLLEQEGVTVRDGRVDLRACRWAGPPGPPGGAWPQWPATAHGSTLVGVSTDHAVRRAQAEDAATVGTLLHEFNTEFAVPTPGVVRLAARCTDLLARPDVLVLLAGPRQGPTGCALLTFRPSPWYEGPVAQLEELYVRPHLRDRGIGTALLLAALADTRARGGGEMRIDVDEVDTDTRRFYERHGFVNVEAGRDHRMLCYLQEL